MIYPVTKDPVPAYMDLEDEELEKVAATVGCGSTDIASALAEAVRDVTIAGDGKFSLTAVATETRRWATRKVRESSSDAPPCVAFLALTVLAAEAMGNAEENLASLAYYARLARLLKLADDDSAVRHQYPRHAEYLWRCLNRWLESLDGERGVPTAYALTYRFVGLPMSQALVRHHDRRRLPLMFAQYGLSPGMRLAPEDLTRYLGDWLTTEGSSATANLRKLWTKPDSHERLASIAAVELANWDGAIGADLARPTSQVAARALVVANLRAGFMGSSLDLSLGLRPLTNDMDGSMEVGATNGSWLPLGFSPGTAGLWRTAYTQVIDFRSLLEGVVRIRHAGDDVSAQYKHFPRMVVPLIYDELQSAFVEAERLQLGVDAMLLVRSVGTTKLAAGAVEDVENVLQQSARPGFKKVDSISGLPEGWVLFTDVQLFGAPSTNTKFNELVPMARNQLTIAGGLRIPSRIRKWSSLSPPEIRAAVQSETHLRVTLTGSMGEEQIAEWKSDSGALAIALDGLALADGDYQVALFSGTKASPIQQASIRLRSSDDVDVQWNEAPRLVYSLDRPLGAISASDHDPGSRFVDGLSADGMSGIEPTVSASAKIFWGRPKTLVKATTIEIGIPDPKSCVVTGAHRIQLPPALGGHAPKFIQGECTSCGLVKRYPGWLPRGGWRSGSGNKAVGTNSAPAVIMDDLQAVQEHDVDWEAALDALMHLGGGSIGSLESIAMQLEGSALFVDNFVRALEALGQLSIERDDRWQPIRWEISPSCLGQQADGAYRLAGFWPGPLRKEVEAFAVANGGHVFGQRVKGNPESVLLTGVSDECAEQLAADAPIAVAPQAGVSILHTLPMLSEVGTALPRSVMPGYQAVERFDLSSASWAPTGDPYKPGAYRLRRGFETVYLYRSGEDVEAGRAAVAPVHLVKHLAANERGKSLASYLDKSQSVLVPQGGDLPGLYGRAAVAIAGHLPQLKKVTVNDNKRKCLVYGCIDRTTADLLVTLLST